jgi:hypothetical protein
MFSTYWAACGSMSTLGKIVLLGDLGIALAYFAIPVGMAIILRQRLTDLPYPWLIALFAAFIVACGLTHLVHAIQMPWTTFEHTVAEAVVKSFCALLSIGTAIALLVLLPRIKYLPSPAAQKAELARAVAERTREKDELVWQIYHQLGNQIQIMQSAINIESRRVKSDEAVQVTDRLAAIVAEMGKHYPDLLKRFDAAHVESTKWPVYVRGREQAERP